MKLRAELKSFRTRRGLTQAELARLCGLSRQSLNQIEAGSTVPSTAVALLLARALGCHVEELFTLSEGDGALPVTLAAPLADSTSKPKGGEKPQARLVLGSVGGRWVAHRLDPRQRARDLAVAADALLPARVAGRSGGVTASVRPLVAQHRLLENLLLAGCDPALGLLADRTDRTAPGSRNLWLEATSGRALAALERSEVHLAGAHLLDPGTGEYNVPFVRAGAAGRPMVVVTVAQIEEGLAVRPGNPKGLRGVADLARKGVRLVNRDPSAGARRLLDRLLEAEGLHGKDVEGYQTCAPGHLDAAHAVASGAADAAVVTCASALALGLDFLPLATERFDLALPKEWLRDPRVSRLLDTLTSSDFRRELASIGGYGTQRCGTLAAEL